jgi:hypothetical protein
MKRAEQVRKRSAALGRGTLLILAVLVASLSGCRKAIPEVATGPKSFASPESAGQAVYLAAKAGDSNAVVSIFGPEVREYLQTGDAEQDKSLPPIMNRCTGGENWKTADACWK